VRLVEAYVFRRAICAIPTNSMNKTFAVFARSIKKDRYLASVKAHFLLMRQSQRFPGDEEFRPALMTRDLYNFPRRSYWLRRLENYGRKERVAVDEYTIEHILPQNPELAEEWRQSLGPEWRSVQERWLHTLGNLTLTAYNTEYSDRPFSEKRAMKGGFAESPLRLNAGLGSLDAWDEAAICRRAEALAAQALAVWAAPAMEESEVRQFVPAAAVKVGEYTIDDHPYLLSASLRPVFESLRSEVLALDPCVHEEFRKQYVTYKADTTVVDVYPQKAKLRLIVNVPFSELVDSRGLCSDMTGNKLNGDVEVSMRTTDDLPYIMGLVRQSYERQMSGDERG